MITANSSPGSTGRNIRAPGRATAAKAMSPAVATAAAGARRPQITTLIYLVNRPDCVASFRAHADKISIIAPQTFYMDAQGFVSGEVPPEVLRIASGQRVAVTPLVVNRGFNQPPYGFCAQPVPNTVLSALMCCPDDGCWCNRSRPALPTCQRRWAVFKGSPDHSSAAMRTAPSAQPNASLRAVDPRHPPAEVGYQTRYQTERNSANQDA